MIAFAMSELHQPYSEIMNIPSLVLRGIIESYVKAKQKANDARNHPQGNTENTGEIPDEDYDTSMWFK